MKINTKVVFEWNPKSKQYEEIYCDSYEYDGEVAECQYWDELPWMGVGQGNMFNQGGMFGQGSDTYNYTGAGYGGGGAPIQKPNLGSSIGLGSYQGSFGNIGGIRGNPQSAYDIRGFGNQPSVYERMANLGGNLPTLQPGLGQFAAGPGTTETTAPSILGGGAGTAPAVGSTIGQSNITGNVLSTSTSAAWPDLNQFSGAYRNISEGFGKKTMAETSKIAAPKVAADVAGKGGLSALWKGMSSTTKALGAGALLGGITGFMQAGSQKKGLGAAIGELDPLKGKFMEAHERQLGLAEAYRPGGRYSRYMGGQLMSQAAESAGQESQRMIASGITSPSMMRAMARQSRRGAQAAMPGMELQLSQMALPYEQMGAQSLTQYGGVVEQLASLRGAKAAVNPWASALSGGMQGMMGAASMAASFMSDRRMKKDIKYLHKSNEGHKVYSFKYKDGDTKYSGVMAQDVLKINPNAVTLKNGMLAVYYDMIDVDMQRLDTI